MVHCAFSILSRIRSGQTTSLLHFHTIYRDFVQHSPHCIPCSTDSEQYDDDMNEIVWG